MPITMPEPPTLRRTLYDGAKNTTPDRQGWVYYATSGRQTPPQGGGATTFSSGSNGASQGGYFRISPLKLDRKKGYTLRFDLQVVTEFHAVPNRAGVGLIALGDDARGIELGFWADQVWAQSDKPLFLHAESASFRTTGRLVHYALTVHGKTYTVTVDGKRLLSGPVRDYSAFHGYPDPYHTPDFLFLGDDSHSAAGAFRLARFQVSVFK